MVDTPTYGPPASMILRQFSPQFVQVGAATAAKPAQIESNTMVDDSLMMVNDDGF